MKLFTIILFLLPVLGFAQRKSSPEKIFQSNHADHEIEDFFVYRDCIVLLSGTDTIYKELGNSNIDSNKDDLCNNETSGFEDNLFDNNGRVEVPIIENRIRLSGVRYRVPRVNYSSQIRVGNDQNGIPVRDGSGKILHYVSRPIYERRTSVQHVVSSRTLVTRFKKPFRVNTSKARIQLSPDLKMVYYYDKETGKRTASKIDLKRPLIRMNNDEKVFTDLITEEVYIQRIHGGNYHWYRINPLNGETTKVAKVRGLDKEIQWKIIDGELFLLKRNEFSQSVHKINFQG